MKDITVREILEAAGGTLLQGEETLRLCSVTTDSREVGTDALFVGIVGETMDGNRFLSSAAENGAKAAMISDRSVYEAYHEKHPEEKDTAVILVDNTTAAIQKTAKMARSRLQLPAVGVTGSVGKTTTREMIAAALSAEKKVYKTSKNYNNWLGVPLTLCDMSDEYDIAVLELGLNVRGELGLISSLSNIDTAVITNIGTAHLEFYGTRDELCREKFTITRGFWEENPREKLLILNGDDPLLRKYRELTGYPYVLYGSTEDCDYRYENIRTENGKYLFDFVKRGEKAIPVELSVLGRHNVSNAAAALTAADHYGVDLNAAAEALSHYTGFRSRLEKHVKDGWTLIDDTYNASPDSMKAGLKVLSEFPVTGDGRRIAVLGDMLELGENSGKYHYEVGAYAASLGIDLFLMRGTDILNAKDALLEKAPGTKICVYEELTALADALRSILRPGDVVYVKASHYTGIHRITEELIGSDA